MLLYPLILFLILLLYFRYRLSRKNLYYHAAKFRGPPTLPIFGNLLTSGGKDAVERFNGLNGLIMEFGNLARFWLGPQLYIVTSDPAVAERVIRDPKSVQGDRIGQKLMCPLLREGIITNNGEKWKKHRKIVMPTFNVKILEEFVDNFAKNSCILVDRLEELADGSTFDPYLYLSLCTLDIICETSMGTTVNAQQNQDCEFAAHVLKSFDIFGERFNKLWLLIDAIFENTSYGKDQQALSKYIHNFSRNIIKKKMIEFENSGSASSEDILVEVPVGKKMAILDLLTRNTFLDEEEMLDEVNTLIIAGSETTATLCAFALCVLGEHQSVQDKIFEEQKLVFGEDLHRPVTNKDLKEMIYLEQVIKETLRLYPIAPSIGRTLTKDIVLDNGLTIPTGAIFLVLSYCMHRDPNVFPNPELFDPDRFSPENSASRHPYAYLPFGGGRRKCVGYIYAMLEAKTILSTLLRRFRVIETVGGLRAIDESLGNDILLKPKNGFNIQMVKRRDIQSVNE